MLFFISSTYRDLVSERNAVQDALRAGGTAPWGMEFFESQPERPLDVCLREIRECDAVILVIGFRAGSLLPAAKTTTYTRAEIERAKEEQKPIFVFVKTADGSWRNDEPAGPLSEALEELRQEIQVGQTVSYFESVDQLKFSVLASVNKWIELGCPGARKTFSSPEEFFRPFEQSSGPPRLFDFHQTLFGRTADLDQLNAFVGSLR